MLTKSIVFCGRPRVLACDGRCDKAWGVNGRPKTPLSDGDDDYVFVGDDALGIAPGPGDTETLSEGGHLKPSAIPLEDAERINKWCARA